MKEEITYWDSNTTYYPTSIVKVGDKKIYRLRIKDLRRKEIGFSLNHFPSDHLDKWERMSVI